MARSEGIEVYLEVGKKRTFAGTIEWPGWARSGQSPELALQALLDYAPRYGRVLRASGLGFEAPAETSALVVVERLKGDATTDFGAPGAAPAADRRPLDDHELERLSAILRASWKALDAALRSAGDRPLRLGPRGGGRQAEQIRHHVLEAQAGYLAVIGQRPPPGDVEDLRHARKAVLDGLSAAVHQGVPAAGPRGGKRWTPRYFVRRSAWHILDHAWEIEDRRT